MKERRNNMNQAKQPAAAHIQHPACTCGKAAHASSKWPEGRRIFHRAAAQVKAAKKMALRMQSMATLLLHSLHWPLRHSQHVHSEQGCTHVLALHTVWLLFPCQTAGAEAATVL